MLRQPADLVPVGHVADSGIETPGLDLAHGLVHPFQGPEDGAGPFQRQDAYDQADDGKQCDDHRQRGLLRVSERRFQKSGVKHADAIAETVQDRFVTRDIPVIHHERPLQPGFAPLQYHVAHLLRDSRAQGPLPLEQTHVGGDTHVIQKQRGGSLAAQRQRAVSIDDAVDLVHEPQVAIEQHPSLQHGYQTVLAVVYGGCGMDRHAAGFVFLVEGGGLLGGDQLQDCP
ncbi:hypothetical protein D9M70_429500 [compost metagenome]